jgi:hypothetical protein
VAPTNAAPEQLSNGEFSLHLVSVL